MADINKIIEEVKSMTVLELNDLVKALEEEFGVSAAAPMAVAGGAAAAPAVAAEEEKTIFLQLCFIAAFRMLIVPIILFTAYFSGTIIDSPAAFDAAR